MSIGERGLQIQTLRELDPGLLVERTTQAGYEMEEMVTLLDQRHYPGILEQWARRFVLERARPMLEGIIEFGEETKRIFRDPREFFGTDDEEETRSLLVDRYPQVNSSSPEFVKKAMIANIELALGNFAFATQQAGFAINEIEVPNFGDELMKNSTKAKLTLLAVEVQKAKILLELIRQFQSIRH